MNTFLFYLFSAAALLSAYFVVTVHNLFRAAMGLIGVLLSIAGLYLLVDAQFLSAVQIMVYVGGIVVLIVYVVLLVADVAQKQVHHAATWRKAVAGFLAAALFTLLAVAAHSHDFGVAQVPARSASVTEIGTALLSPERNGYVLPFEVISLVLVAAIVGAITIARGAGSDKKEAK
ncbi:MAG: NADH-quinone oxidoreductase subunit J [Verrucomicrobia bacterium]|nr:NADH-quinone oxidoreductase subunit J [Verrucomicrobiota bacterium]